MPIWIVGRLKENGMVKGSRQSLCGVVKNLDRFFLFSFLGKIKTKRK